MLTIGKNKQLAILVLGLCLVCVVGFFFYQKNERKKITNDELVNFAKYASTVNQTELAFLSVEQFYALEVSFQQLRYKLEDSDNWKSVLLVVQGLKVIQTIAQDNEVILEKFPPNILYTSKDLVDNSDSYDRMLANMSRTPNIFIRAPRPCNHKR